jgi:uncharacterized membrane protein YGL010W
LRSVHSWLEEYGESHQDHTNKMVHWVCVPAIMFSIVGLVGPIPEPAVFRSLPPLSWATLTVGLALVYYFLLSPALGTGMLFVSVVMLGTLHHLANAGAPITMVCVALFVVAWIGQFVGHKIEGKKPSFFRDIQFLLIGPLWLLAFVYRRIGIPY